MGLFADEKIQHVGGAGKFLREYIGEKINKKEHERRALKYGKSHSYTINLTGGIFLDCRSMREQGVCLASMANDFRGLVHRHTGRPAEANARLYSPKSGRPGIYTLRAIQRGEEIFVDYGNTFFTPPEKIIMSNRKVKESSVVEMVGEYGVLWEYASVTEAAKQNKKGFSTIMGSIKTGNRFKGVYFRWKVPRAADATYMVDILADTESEPETEPETEQPETEPEPETAETEVKGDFFSTLWEKLCRPH
jgi:hypothetical protein